MKRLLLLMGLTTALVGLAAPAHADESGSDAEFLGALSGAGLSHRGANQAIVAGHAVCKLMDAGLSPMDTVVAVQSTNPGFTTEHAAKFAVISATSYCPEHM
ncbi:DUF732 domain-containing protein [Mycobacterium talmoniae]|uniref:DUF732 domain-containing protein n=1 Tax=Mycobacterium talmoniae TaxID=1858794 RepID=A0A1S1NB40_9MYCO|nr:MULTISPECIES: DUF732 domain-containing protein [Mycobacterium]OHV00359.1 hypothetical protein BKN37_18085 [Mycobacterium talmoniae]PQM45507.1 hypothetical protein C1Y40_04330 [Mycobacterium talmoniae]TDH50031.1 DUF732 domain-containing protein [Mycobacterium eburneum]